MYLTRLPYFAWKVRNPCGTSLRVENCKPIQSEVPHVFTTTNLVYLKYAVLLKQFYIVIFYKFDKHIYK